MKTSKYLTVSLLAASLSTSAFAIAGAQAGAEGGTAYGGNSVMSDFSVTALVQTVVQFITPGSRAISWTINPLNPSASDQTSDICLYTNNAGGLDLQAVSDNQQDLWDGRLLDNVGNDSGITYQVFLEDKAGNLNSSQLRLDGESAFLAMADSRVSNVPCDQTAGAVYGSQFRFVAALPPGVLSSGTYKDTVHFTVTPHMDVPAKELELAKKPTALK